MRIYKLIHRIVRNSLVRRIEIVSSSENRIRIFSHHSCLWVLVFFNEMGKVAEKTWATFFLGFHFPDCPRTQTSSRRIREPWRFRA